jgi:hypothetical protein
MRRFIQKHKRCRCGQAKTQHGGLDIEVRGQAVHQEGLGECGAAGCDCAKFRRHGWVIEDEQQRGRIQRPPAPNLTSGGVWCARASPPRFGS